jgi:hypothetical protein
LFANVTPSEKIRRILKGERRAFTPSPCHFDEERGEILDTMHPNFASGNAKRLRFLLAVERTWRRGIDSTLISRNEATPQST